MNKSKLLSKCCGVEVRMVIAGGGFTGRYYCSKCKKICDTTEEVQNEETNEEHLEREVIKEMITPIMQKEEKETPKEPEEWKEIIEKLADIEHQRWSDWMEYMFDCAIKSGDDNIGIRTLGFPTKQFENWERQIETDYKDLTEKEKQSDRDQVMRYFPIIQSLLSQKDKEWREKIEKEIERLGIEAEKADTAIGNENLNEFFTKKDAEKLITENLKIMDLLEALLKPTK